MGEPLDLGVDGSDRLVGELFGGTGEGAHALINSSVTLKAGMLGPECQVARDEQGSSNVACAAASLRPMPTEDALPQVAKRPLWDRPARPKLGVRLAAASHGEPPGGC